MFVILLPHLRKRWDILNVGEGWLPPDCHFTATMMLSLNRLHWRKSCNSSLSRWKKGLQFSQSGSLSDTFLSKTIYTWYIRWLLLCSEEYFQSWQSGKNSIKLMHLLKWRLLYLEGLYLLLDSEMSFMSFGSHLK